MADFLQTLTVAVTIGSLYALIALGYTMVYGILKLINFAHSDVVVLGAWVSLALSTFLLPRLGVNLAAPPWWAGVVILIAAMAVCGVTGLLIERLAYKPLRRAPRLNALITAMGVSLLLQNVGQLQWTLIPAETRVANGQVTDRGPDRRSVVLDKPVTIKPGTHYVVKLTPAAGTPSVQPVSASPGDYAAGKPVNLAVDTIGRGMVRDASFELSTVSTSLKFPFGAQPDLTPTLLPVVTHAGDPQLQNVLYHHDFTGTLVQPDGTTKTFVKSYQLPLVDVVIVACAIALMAGLEFLVFHTRFGTAMRAVSFNTDFAALMGIPIDRVISITFVLGAVLAAAAGFLYGADVRSIAADGPLRVGAAGPQGVRRGGRRRDRERPRRRRRRVPHRVHRAVRRCVRHQGLARCVGVHRRGRVRAADPGAAGQAQRAVRQHRTGEGLMTGFPRWAAFVLIAGLAAGLQLTVGRFLGDYAGQIAISVGVAMTLAVSLNIVNGYTGQFSIGHAAFFAIGAYAAAAVTFYGSVLVWDDPQTGSAFGGQVGLFVVATAVGGLVAAAAGWLVGLPSLRLQGDYLAIVTLGFGEILRILLQQTNAQIFSRAELHAATFGQFVPPPLGGALGFINAPKVNNVFWTALFTGLTILVAWRLKKSTFGRGMIAIRENEIAAESMGVNVTRLKVWAFVIAAFFAGVAGSLYAHTIGTTVGPRDAGFTESFNVVIMVVLGGLGSISGAALAAVLWVVANQWLLEPTHVWHVGLGVLAVRLIAWPFDRVRAAAWGVGLIAVVEGLRSLAVYNGVDLGKYRIILFALVLILVMIGRPGGLFGTYEITDLPRARRKLLAGREPTPDLDPVPAP